MSGIKIKSEELEDVNGGLAIGSAMSVCNLQAGYLAVRTRPEAARESEICSLYNGDEVQIAGGSVQGTGFGGQATYVWVYVPKYKVYGYVNQNYIG